MGTLYAFYDLAAAPPTYEYFIFMEMAELARRRRGLDRIHMIFVPGPKGGFRDDNLPPDLPAREAFMRNLVIPASFLLPNLAGFCWAESRLEANLLFEQIHPSAIFPHGYTPARPFSEYIGHNLTAAAVRGERIGNLTAPPDRLLQAERYLSNIAGGRKPVTITLRESSYYPQRNSRYDVWGKVVEYFKGTEYFPIIIRDTEKIYAPLEGIDAPVCAQPSIDILFRVALYQRSYMNLFTSNGAYIGALHSGAPMIVFKMHNPDFFCATAEYFARCQAIQIREPYPYWRRNQLTVWADDGFDTIISAFRSHSARMDKGGADLSEPNGFTEPGQIAMASKVLTEMLMAKGLSNLADTDIDTLLGIAGLDPGNLQAVLVGGSYAAMGQKFDQALSVFDQCLARHPTDPRVIRGRAVILEALGRIPEALAGFRALQDVEPSIETASKITNLQFIDTMS